MPAATTWVFSEEANGAPSSLSLEMLTKARSFGGDVAAVYLGSGSDEAFAIVQEIGSLLAGIESGSVTRGGGGADITPLMATGVPGMGLSVDGTRYFWYHHSDADTVDKLDPDEVALCVATMAVIAYVVADMPQRLPR